VPNRFLFEGLLFLLDFIATTQKFAGGRILSLELMFPCRFLIQFC
jgi:hypothetical protein